ncbi:MAG TPA: AMP-binding protein, partial [Hyphomicrobiaceae bacterium]|nr:AMP-binding protein [Hyphomicrobiaceae bacterium]
MGEERPWERSYPPGVRWDAPLEISTLPAMLDAFTAQWGPRPAFEYRDHTISYAELGEVVDSLASGLVDLGVRPGTAVALYLPNTPYHPIAFFAVLRCGGRVVNLSPLDAERELAFKLQDSGACIMVTTNIGALLPMAQKLKDAGLIERLIVGDDTAFGPAPHPITPINGDANLIRFETLREAGAAKLPRAWPQLDVGDIALLQYTGGTTGLPKGAMLTHGNLTAAAAAYSLWNGGRGPEGERRLRRMIGVLPLFHIYAFTCDLLLTLAGGHELLIRARF